jgi:Zn-dependent protease
MTLAGFNLIDLLYVIFALIMGLTLHEFAHALAGEWLGDSTARREGRLSLNPFAHIDPIMTLLLPAALIILHSPVVFGAARPVPFKPWAVRYGKWGAALIAAAGPAMNLLIAIVAAAILRWLPLTSGLVTLFITIISINISFMIFNLIPIPPLDGSRIVYAAVPPLRPLFDTLERNGLAVIIVLLLVAGPIITPLLSSAVGAMMQLLVPGLTGLST